MNISVRMSEKDLELVKKYAALYKTTVSDVIRKAVLEKIEDEFDVCLYEKADNEFQKNPKTCTIDEAKKFLGIK